MKSNFKSIALALASLLIVAGSAETSCAKSTSKKTSTSSSVTTIYKSADGKEWIHKGKKGIISYKDSTGVVRVVVPYTGKPSSGRGYAEKVSEYARRLKDDNVKVYALLAPNQGEFYLPEQVSTQGAEQACIEGIYSYLDPLVTPVMVCDTLRAHSDEKIYSYTDHHWAPLGAYYAGKVLAEKAGVPFRPLSDYTKEVVNDYVGTMYSFSGDPAVKTAYETFEYYMPPEGYETEFVKYKVTNGKTVSEGEPVKGEFFRKYKDGSSGAYCTFMGGDYCATKVTNTGGTPGRKILIVKDSFGNAVAPTLFGSFEEVHVLDFRYFPHGLLDYIRKNGITDLVFINTLSIGASPRAAERFGIMMH